MAAGQGHLVTRSYTGSTMRHRSLTWVKSSQRFSIPLSCYFYIAATYHKEKWIKHSLVPKSSTMSHRPSRNKGLCPPIYGQFFFFLLAENIINQLFTTFWTSNFEPVSTYYSYHRKLDLSCMSFEIPIIINFFTDQLPVGRKINQLKSKYWMHSGCHGQSVYDEGRLDVSDDLHWGC